MSTRAKVFRTYSLSLTFFLMSGCLLINSTPTSAQENDTVWTTSAKLRLRAEAKVNQHFRAETDALTYRKPDNLDRFSQRTRLALQAKKGRMSGFFQIQQGALWGSTGGYKTTDAAVTLHQAWFEIAPQGWSKLQVGRFELVYGDKRVLGDANWSLNGRAWDGVRAKLDLGDDLKLDLFAAQHHEGSNSAGEPDSSYSGGLFDDDAWLSGIYFMIGEGTLGPALKAIDLYLLADATFETPESDTDFSLAKQRRVTSGARLNGAWGMVEATAEGAYQFGSACVVDPLMTNTCSDERIDFDAWFVDSEVKLKLHKSLSVVLGAGQATGDDPDTDDTIESYNHVASAAHKYLGSMDVVGPRTNVRDLRLGVISKFDKLSLKLIGLDFTRIKPETERTGFEVDALLGYKFSKGLKSQLGYSVFLPAEGATLDDSQPGGVAQWVYAQMQASF